MEPTKKKKKQCDLSGWCKAATPDRLKKMKQHPVAGDWRRFEMIKVKSIEAVIKWKNISTEDIYSFTTPVAVGMREALKKMESQQNLNFKHLPVVVKEHFGLTETTYKPHNFTVNVSFGVVDDESQYSDFMFAYCRLYSSKSNLKKLF